MKWADFFGAKIVQFIEIVKKNENFRCISC